MASILRRAARKIGLGHVIRILLKTDDRLDARPKLLPARPRSTPTRYLSIAAIFKDEAPYLAEWLEFHRLVGVEHVYLYDNGSTDSPCTFLEPYIREGFVSVIPWAFPWLRYLDYQCIAYAHAIVNFGIHWRWMAFIDIDEFLFPVEGNSLPATLAQYESLPSVAAYWKIYGFNGHESPPLGLTIENYTKPTASGLPVYPKSIVDPSKVIGIESPHMFNFAEGRRIVYDEQKRLRHLEGEHGPSNILRLNHYVTRSREEFAAKLAKWDQADLKHGDRRRRQTPLLEEGAFPDDTILRFVPEVKQRLRDRAGHNLEKSDASTAQAGARIRKPRREAGTF